MMYVFIESRAYRERWRGEAGIDFQLLIDSPNDHNGWGWKKKTYF